MEHYRRITERFRSWIEWKRYEASARRIKTRQLTYQERDAIADLMIGEQLGLRSWR